VVPRDQRCTPQKFKTGTGFEHTYMWSTNGTLESDLNKIEQQLPNSALSSGRWLSFAYRDLCACKDRCAFVMLGARPAS
jgi:hypothetical protein